MTDIDAVLRTYWLALRNSLGPTSVSFVKGAVCFAHEAALISLEQYELWMRRIQTCPGHDDEGWRTWCAYCGTLPKENET